MKKSRTLPALLSLVLALAMMLSLSVTAFAASPTNCSESLLKKLTTATNLFICRLLVETDFVAIFILKICRVICGLLLHLAMLRIHTSRLMLSHMRTRDFIIVIAKRSTLFRPVLRQQQPTEQAVRKQFSTEEILLRSAHTLMFLFLRTVRLLLTSLTIWFFREQQG